MCRFLKIKGHYLIEGMTPQENQKYLYFSLIHYIYIGTFFDYNLYLLWFLNILAHTFLTKTKIQDIFLFSRSFCRQSPKVTSSII